MSLRDRYESNVTEDDYWTSYVQDIQTILEEPINE